MPSLLPGGQADAAGERATIHRQTGKHLVVNHSRCQVGKVRGSLNAHEGDGTQPGAGGGSVPKDAEAPDAWEGGCARPARQIRGWQEVATVLS